MLFKQLSERWAQGICRVAGETDAYKIALIRYTFEGILSFCLSFTLLLITAWLLGIFKTALLIGVTGAVVKSFTGGLHLGTPLRCAVGGAIMLTAISYLAIYFPITAIPAVIVYTILGAINIIVWWKAPRESKGKPLSPKQKTVLGVFSKVIVLLISIVCLLWTKSWGINELFYGTVFQVLNLLDVTARGLEKADYVFGKIEKKPVF